MASHKEYMQYILDQLSDVDGITFRPMMGNIFSIFMKKLRPIFVMTGCWSNRFPALYP